MNEKNNNEGAFQSIESMIGVLEWGELTELEKFIHCKSIEVTTISSNCSFELPEAFRLIFEDDIIAAKEFVYKTLFEKENQKFTMDTINNLLETVRKSPIGIDDVRFDNIRFLIQMSCRAKWKYGIDLLPQLTRLILAYDQIRSYDEEQIFFNQWRST